METQHEAPGAKVEPEQVPVDWEQVRKLANVEEFEAAYPHLTVNEKMLLASVMIRKLTALSQKKDKLLNTADEVMHDQAEQLESETQHGRFLNTMVKALIDHPTLEPKVELALERLGHLNVKQQAELRKVNLAITRRNAKIKRLESSNREFRANVSHLMGQADRDDTIMEAMRLSYRRAQIAREYLAQHAGVDVLHAANAAAAAVVPDNLPPVDQPLSGQFLRENLEATIRTLVSELNAIQQAAKEEFAGARA